MRLSALIHDYLKSLIQRDVSPLTYRDYSHYLNRYLVFAGDIDIRELNEFNIAKYRNYLSAYVDSTTGLTLKRITQNYMLIALRCLIKYANERNLIDLTKESISLVKTQKYTPPIIHKDQIEQLLNTPDSNTKVGLRDKAILETLFSSGLLVSELSSLNRENVDLGGKEIIFEGKSGRGRSVYLFDRCLYWLKYYLSKRNDNFKPLFIRYQGTPSLYDNGERMRLTPRSLERIVEKYARAMGLRGKITPQTFRHFLAVSLIKEGVESQTVQQVLGYESDFSTNQYLKNLKETDGIKKS